MFDVLATALPSTLSGYDEVEANDSTPCKCYCPTSKSIMNPSGANPNPWIIVNETTMSGCQGSGAAASSGGNGSSKRPDKHSANDGPSPTDDQSTTSDTMSGANSCPLTSGCKHSSHIPKDKRNFLLTSDIEQLENSGHYKLHQGFLPSGISFAISPGCQQGSVLKEVTPRLEVPRSMANYLEPPTLAVYSFSMPNNQSDAMVQEQSLSRRYYDQTRLQETGSSNYQGSKEAKKATSKHGPHRKDTTQTKQNAQDAQNIPGAEYRQFDKQTTQEDAERDDEVSQEQDRDEKGYFQN